MEFSSHPFSIDYKFYIDGQLLGGHLMIPEGVTRIGNNLFEYCNDIQKVTFPDSLKSVGDNAFSNCKNLIDISFGNGLEKFGTMTFSYCRKLVEVFYRDPSSRRFITLENTYAPGEGASILTVKDGLIFAKKKSAYMLMGYSGPKTVLSLPDTINGNDYAIHENAFFRSALKEIAVPENVTYIEAGAFNACDDLIKLTIPYIGCGVDKNDEFYYLFTERYNSVDHHAVPASLTELVITGGTSIPADTFEYCDLQKITLPDTVTAIYANAFHATNIRTIVIPDSVNYISAKAFYNCRYLTSVIFAESEGWTVAHTDGDAVAVPAADLADAAKVAKYLTQGYCHENDKWQRS